MSTMNHTAQANNTSSGVNHTLDSIVFLLSFLSVLGLLGFFHSPLFLSVLYVLMTMMMMMGWGFAAGMVPDLASCKGYCLDM